jgi:hypothetical protein
VADAKLIRQPVNDDVLARAQVIRQNELFDLDSNLFPQWPPLNLLYAGQSRSASTHRLSLSIRLVAYRSHLGCCAKGSAQVPYRIQDRLYR